MNKIALFLGGVVITMSSCTKQPSACFEASAETVAVGESVSFDNCSEDAEVYDWDFGDNNSSDSKSPSHSFDQGGTYTVELTALSKNEKKKESESVTITVYDAADFAGSYSVSAAYQCQDAAGTITGEDPAWLYECEITAVGQTLILDHDWGLDFYANPTSASSFTYDGDRDISENPDAEVYATGSGSINNGVLTYSLEFKAYDKTTGDLLSSCTDSTN